GAALDLRHRAPRRVLLHRDIRRDRPGDPLHLFPVLRGPFSMVSTKTTPDERRRLQRAAWARLLRWADSDIPHIAIPFLAGAWFYGTRWLGTFPLIEYRNWLAYPFSPSSVTELLRNLAWRDIPFSRDVSLFAVQLTGAGCGLRYG